MPQVCHDLRHLEKWIIFAWPFLRMIRQCAWNVKTKWTQTDRVHSLGFSYRDMWHLTIWCDSYFLSTNYTSRAQCYTNERLNSKWLVKLSQINLNSDVHILSQLPIQIALWIFELSYCLVVYLGMSWYVITNLYMMEIKFFKLFARVLLFTFSLI